jgi:hypothetical protein
MVTVLVAALAPHGARGCTSIAVGRLASANGSPMVTHSDDSGGAADIRVVRVPAATHAPGAMRPVYLSVGTFPRLIAPERSPDYSEASLPDGYVLEKAKLAPLGHIPQVASTFGAPPTPRRAVPRAAPSGDVAAGYRRDARVFAQFHRRPTLAAAARVRALNTRTRARAAALRSRAASSLRRARRSSQATSTRTTAWPTRPGW